MAIYQIFSIDDMKINIFLIILVLILLFFLPHVIAGTDIYKYVDKDGNITFTNRPISNAQKISITSLSRNTEQSRPQSKSLHVKNTTQKERDAMRRQILEKELMIEEKLFADTQSSLTHINGNSHENNSQEKTVQLKNKLFLHQRNITALKKELTKL